MRPRIIIARFIIRLANFIKSLSLMVMRPDDIIGFVRDIYSKEHKVNEYGDTGYVDDGLDSDENELLRKIPYAGGRLLLLGVGGGREAISLARLGFQVTGVDFIPEMLDRAKQNAKRNSLDIQCLLQEFSKLDLDEESYDNAWTSVLMYSYVPTRQRRIDMLMRIHKALRPGGILVCQFRWDSKYRPSRIVTLLKRALAWITLGYTSYEPGDILWYNTEFLHIFQSEEELKAEFLGGGFKVDHLIVNEKTNRGGAILKKI